MNELYTAESCSNDFSEGQIYSLYLRPDYV